ncbi:MAG TPA: DUF4149 domain-containing protein [Haliangiales bacterium]|nr:DUF4149 domain-containing protein [Haliangiales bacterium]
MIGFLRFVGVANAAIWFGASIFFTLFVGPAFFSEKMISLLTRPYAGAAAQIIIERYFLMQQVCATLALVHLVAEWLYMGKPLQRLTLWLLLGISTLGLVGGYGLQPRLRRLHRTIYGSGSTLQQIEQARQSFKLWHGTSQALNLVVIAGVAVYLWRVTTPGSGYRYRA